MHLQGSQILDLWGLLFPLNHSPENWCSWPESHRQPQPSEGCALIIELQERKNGASCRCCPGATFLQRKPAGCRKEAKWSQSPVLPWTQRAYETCLSAGSTAFGLWKWSPHPELHPQGCQILSLDPLLFGFNHMRVNWCTRQDSHLQTLRSKRSVIVISPRMRKWGRWRDSHSRGAMRPAVYETAAVAAEPHRQRSKLQVES